MSPSQPPGDSEARLLQLLALKRHELPPPGFFDRLPARILTGIRAGTEVEETPWWDRVWAMLRHQPMVVGSYATLAVGVLFFGVSVLLTAVEGSAFQAPGLPGIQANLPTSAGFLSDAGGLPTDMVAVPVGLHRLATPSPVIFVEPATMSLRAGRLENLRDDMDGIQVVPAAYQLRR